MNDLKNSMLIAYAAHEAGHAIVGMAFGKEVDELSVLTRNDVGGLCGFAPSKVLWEMAERTIEAAGVAAMEILALSATHRIRNADLSTLRAIMASLPPCPPNDPIGLNDLERIRLAVRVECGEVPTEVQVTDAFREAMNLASDLLRWYSVEVGIVAHALAERRVLSGIAVRSLVCDLMPKPPGISRIRRYLSPPSATAHYGGPVSGQSAFP